MSELSASVARVLRTPPGAAVAVRRAMHHRNTVRVLRATRTLTAVRGIRRAFLHTQGYRFGASLEEAHNARGLYELESGGPRGATPLEEYFDAHEVGPGVWKWRHYFPVYHRHLSKFVGREVNVVEIGVYSGGSLRMWKEYFGQGCRVYGVDIEDSCKAHEDESIQIFIGDQGDPEFWERFLGAVPAMDVIIDDGGHRVDQQIVTLDALLTRLRPGGVYICEDVASKTNPFLDYVCGLARNLNAWQPAESFEANPFQRIVDSVHLYPFVIVIERTAVPRIEITSEVRGSEWEQWSPR